MTEECGELMRWADEHLPAILWSAHGGQEFVWGPPVVAGDEVATEVEVKDAADRGDLRFYVFESRSTNQDGETVCTGTWTNIVR